MINIPKLHLRSGAVQLSELTLRQSIALSVIPAGKYEESNSAFIRFSCPECNPLVMTVQDRMMLVAHYLASTSENPDFSVGNSHFSDYLIGDEKERISRLDVGNVGGDDWYCRQLTGEFSEAIERLQGDLDLSQRMHWIIGRMASQLCREGESLEFDDIDVWLKDRMTVISNYPESDFLELLARFDMANREMSHLFYVDNDNFGLVALQKGEGSAVKAGRFPASSVVDERIKAMAI